MHCRPRPHSPKQHFSPQQVLDFSWKRRMEKLKYHCSDSTGSQLNRSFIKERLRQGRGMLVNIRNHDRVLSPRNSRVASSTYCRQEELNITYKPDMSGVTQTTPKVGISQLQSSWLKHCIILYSPGLAETCFQKGGGNHLS